LPVAIKGYQIIVSKTQQVQFPESNFFKQSDLFFEQSDLFTYFARLATALNHKSFFLQSSTA